MGNFVPYEGLKLTNPNTSYIYTILDVAEDTLKCNWRDIVTDETGYCEMSVDYAEKLNNLCLDSLTICRKE